MSWPAYLTPQLARGFAGVTARHRNSVACKAKHGNRDNRQDHHCEADRAPR